MPENTLPVPEVENVVVEKTPPDYSVPITVGQYWVKQGLVVAFVLEVNEFAVIYQVQFSFSDKDSVLFDFDAGQEISTIDTFRTHLKEREAEIFDAPSNLVEIAVNIYKQKMAERKIMEFKILPRNQEEAQELNDIETYRFKKRIVPPPIKYRGKKGYHWLKAGIAGTMTVCKLWDPKVDNWVMHSGEVDQTGAIGFVTGYHAPAETTFAENDLETFAELSTRFIDFLRSKSYMFDEKSMRTMFENLNPLKFIPDKEMEELISKQNHIPAFVGVVESEDEDLKFPVYQFSYGIIEGASENNTLYVTLSHNQKDVCQLRFVEVVNGEFIPNQTAELIALN